MAAWSASAASTGNALAGTAQPFRPSWFGQLCAGFGLQPVDGGDRCVVLVFLRLQLGDDPHRLEMVVVIQSVGLERLGEGVDRRRRVGSRPWPSRGSVGLDLSYSLALGLAMISSASFCTASRSSFSCASARRCRRANRADGLGRRLLARWRSDTSPRRRVRLPPCCAAALRSSAERCAFAAVCEHQHVSALA